VRACVRARARLISDNISFNKCFSQFIKTLGISNIAILLLQVFQVILFVLNVSGLLSVLQCIDCLAVLPEHWLAVSF